MSWKDLSSSQLQKILGTEILESLCRFLPRITNGEIDEHNIFLKKNMVKLVDAFADSSWFSRREFRENLFLMMPEALITRTMREVEGQSDVRGARDGADLAGIPWEDPVLTGKILRSLGFSDRYSALEKERHPSGFRLVVEKPFFQLKDYQFGVFFQSLEMAGVPRNRFIVQMPTGTGKTRTSIELVCHKLNEWKKNAVVIWLAHSEELCDQAMACFSDVGSHLVKHPVQAHRFWDRFDSLPEDEGVNHFVVCGFQKGYSQLEKLGRLSDSFTIALVVIDEAHKAIAKTYQEVIKHCLGDNTVLVGLTATPGRADISESARLSEFFFHQVISINCPSEVHLFDWLRERGILSKVNYQSITGVDIALTPKERRYLEVNFDFPNGFLEKLGKSDVRNIEIIKSIQLEVRSGRQVLFFANSVAHSKFVTAILVYLGIAAAHVDGYTSKAIRAKTIRDFKNQNLRVLSNFGVLSTGFDAPKTDVVVISRPTKSLVLYSQMIGRGLRGPSLGGTESCKIIQVKDNFLGLPEEDEIFESLQRKVEAFGSQQSDQD